VREDTGVGIVDYGVQVGKSVENLVVNPSFEDNVTDGWSLHAGSGGVGTRTRSTAKHVVGTASGRIKADDTDDAYFYETVGHTVADDETFTASCFAYENAAGRAKLVIRDTTNSIDRATTTGTATSQFEGLVCTWKNETGGNVTVEVRLINTTGNGSAVTYFDAVQLSETPCAMCFCDGSLGEGHGWSGDADNSSSNRTTAYLRYTPTMQTKWTLSLHTTFPFLWSKTSPTPHVLNWRYDADNSFYIFVASATSKLRCNFKRGGTNNWVTIIDGDPTPFHNYHIEITSDDSTLRIYVDGTEVGSGTALSGALAHAPNDLVVGATHNGTSNIPGMWVDELIILDSVMSSAEVAQMSADYGFGIRFRGVWTDVWDDVRATFPVKCSYGITGFLPTARIARQGNLDFYLDNSETNSGGKVGYYTPGHTDARTGFRAGIGVRWVPKYSVDYYKFWGKLSLVEPKPGVKEERHTHCQAGDFLTDMSFHKVNLLEVQEDIKSDQLFQAIIDNMPFKPLQTSFTTGQETFAFAGDQLKDEKNTALAAVTKIAMSEFGYIYQKGGTTGGGTLVFEDRHQRIKHTSVDSTISGEFVDAPLTQSTKYVFNKIKGIAYPREVSSGRETLFTMQRVFDIKADKTETFIVRFTDPSNRDARLSGIDFTEPEGENELTTNSISSGFEENTTGWTASAGAVISQSDDQAKAGTGSMKLLSGTGATNKYYVTSDKMSGFAQDDVVYIRAYVYIPAAWPDSVELCVVEYKDDDSWIGHHTIDSSNLTGQWVRLKGTHTVASADAAKLGLFVGEADNQDFSGGAVSVYVDQVYLIDDAKLNFEFSSTESGGGDMNNDLILMDSIFGGNSAEFHLKNVGSSTGYVTGLKMRAKAIRTYEPAIAYAEDTDDNYRIYGVREMSLVLAYQDDVLKASDWANIVFSTWHLPQLLLQSATFYANRSDTLLTAALAREPGDRVKLTETVSGIDTEFFINSVQLVLEPGNILKCTWTTVLASSVQYWILGTSKLGTETKLGF
jgi:hypothetical protein